MMLKGVKAEGLKDLGQKNTLHECFYATRSHDFKLVSYNPSTLQCFGVDNDHSTFTNFTSNDDWVVLIRPNESGKFYLTLLSQNIQCF